MEVGEVVKQAGADDIHVDLARDLGEVCVPVDYTTDRTVVESFSFFLGKDYARLGSEEIGKGERVDYVADLDG